jgi:predicted flap endonuclease-1-like 5' DNA nuclease
MSSAKKNQQGYEALLKNYERAQAQFTRTQLIEKTAKKNLKKAIKGDASKSEVEVLRLELEIAKSKRKGRKAGAAIAKSLMKQWIKENAKGKKSYKLTIREEIPVPTPIEVPETTDDVKAKRSYNRREKTDAEISETPVIEEGKAGKSARKIAVPVEVVPEKPRSPRRSSAEVKAEKEAAQAALKESGDDFSIIEGIGATMTLFLHSIGIKNFATLAAVDPVELKAQLNAHRKFAADPTTWGQQAQLVVDNNWEALKELQETLKRPRS